jgi:hypothetical protein
VAVCIETGRIVWINGPYPCGKYPDITIFRSALINLLAPGEQVEADLGYRGEQDKVKTPYEFLTVGQYFAKKRARNRQEAVNGRFKQFTILSSTFRHDISKHADVFYSVAVITQLSFIYNDKPIWAV